MVVENIAGVVVLPNAGVLLLFPKVGLLDEPNGIIIELDEPKRLPITEDVCPDELNTDVVFSPLPNTGNFASCVPKIDLLSALPLNTGILFSGAENPDGLAVASVKTVGLSAWPNVIGVFESLNNGVELETIGKAEALSVSLTAALSEDSGGGVGVALLILFSPNDRFVESAGDDAGAWPKVGTAAVWGVVFGESENVREG